MIECPVAYDGKLDVEAITSHGVFQRLVVAEQVDLGLTRGFWLVKEELRACVCVCLCVCVCVCVCEHGHSPYLELLLFH